MQTPKLQDDVVSPSTPSRRSSCLLPWSAKWSGFRNSGTQVQIPPTHLVRLLKNRPPGHKTATRTGVRGRPKPQSCCVQVNSSLNLAETSEKYPASALAPLFLTELRRKAPGTPLLLLQRQQTQNLQSFPSSAMFCHYATRSSSAFHEARARAS